jgi:hypothetical protein
MIRADAVSFDRTGWIVEMSVVVASMTRPPCWAVSVAAAEVDAPGVLLELHETATSMAAPRTATSRRIDSLPPIAHFVTGDISIWYAGH